MSANSNIILITNDDEIAGILKPQLVLLREIDTITVSDYSNAVENLKNYNSDTAIIYCSVEQKDCLNLIKKIKSEDSIKNTSILLVVKEYEQDFILSAYDENISDFLVLKQNDAEILMRTIWSLKKNALSNTVKKHNNLLEKLNVINPKTGFYTEKFCEDVFENEFKTIRDSKTEGIIIAISPTEESKTQLNPLYLSIAIKKSTRNSDVLAHGPANKFYVLLSKTNLKGAYCVWDRIKKAVGDQYSIIAGLCDIEKKPFKELKTELLNALIEAETTKTDMVVSAPKKEAASADWLDKINSNQKNFKLFKQAFNKKLEKVITPVFFQMQKLWEEKLFKTKIEQYSNSTQSSFLLKRPDQESELKITYPGFSKINIDIVHQGLDSPENSRISLDLTELDENRLTKILQDFIQEFKSTIKE